MGYLFYCSADSTVGYYYVGNAVLAIVEDTATAVSRRLPVFVTAHP